jgi:hypothetical protein
MNVPITLHIVTGRIPDPMACHTLAEWEEGPNMFLATWEEIPHVLATDFIFGKILDRFPRLRVVTAELELSWIPNFMRRIDMVQGVHSNRLQLPSLDFKASDYIRPASGTASSTRSGVCRRSRRSGLTRWSGAPTSSHDPVGVETKEALTSCSLECRRRIRRSWSPRTPPTSSDSFE